MPEFGLICMLAFYDTGPFSGFKVRYEYYIVNDAPACQRVADSKKASSGTPSIVEMNKLKIYCGQNLDRCEKVPSS